MKIDLSKESIKQFISYFGVGGTAALVEWAAFSLFENALGIPYLAATALAFLVSTTVNWLLGRAFTFKNSAYKDHKAREMALVFLVSAVGLGFNMLLMYLFVSVLGMDTHLLKTAAKVLSTGIVFLWNFASRKYLIYKN